MNTIQIDYVNWKGRREKRKIRPLYLSFGSNEFHKEPQWLLFAVDDKDKAVKSFALSGIQNPQEIIIPFEGELVVYRGNK